MKIIKNSTLLGVLVAIGIMLAWYYASWIDTRYTRTGTIEYIEPFYYELTDPTGHRFGFYSNDILKDGTKIKATLDTKGTVSYVYDDEVIDYEIVFDSQD